MSEPLRRGGVRRQVPGVRFRVSVPWDLFLIPGPRSPDSGAGFAHHLDEYRRAKTDPLAESADSILEHMNADHREALVLYCRVFSGVEADEATMTAIDRLGFRVRARVGEQMHGLRINFPREVQDPTATRAVLVEMVRRLR